MLRSIRQISLLNKLFNVQGNEWSRVGAAWFLIFLYRVGFVIGWTVIVGMFASKYGIFSLPYLFALNALFTILGSVIFSTCLDKFKTKNIMAAILIFAAALLLAAYVFSGVNQTLFFAFLIVAEAGALVHFRIMFSGSVEERFTPLESERTFPLIESSETLGGIAAGVLVVMLSNNIDVSRFVQIWIGIILVMIPALFLYENLNRGIVKIPKSAGQEKSPGIFMKLKRELKRSSYASYIKGLAIIVFFQWFLFNLMEFQYTKAVYQNVSHVILEAGGGFEHTFVHDLGALFILFSVSALIIQLFVGSRLINFLGVYGSMLLHPIVTFFSVFGLSISFSYANAVLAKNNFTVTSAIHLNAYHSSYYAIKENIRRHMRQIFEGIVRPVGAISGTLVLILLQRVFDGGSLLFSINLSMIVVCFVIFAVTYFQQEKYTRAAINDLLDSGNKEVRFNAIDILAQKGHRSSIPVLKGVLLNAQEPVSIRVRVLHALSEARDVSVVKDVLKCLDSDRYPIRDAALDTLMSYKFLFKRRKKYMVLEHEIIETLKLLYKKEKTDEMRSKIITVLSKISSVATFEFLLEVLKNSRGSLKADVIYSLGNYDDESVVKYLRPYMNARDPGQKLAAIIALGRKKSYRDEAVGIIAGLLNSGRSRKISEALYAIGELNLKNKKRICLHYSHSKNTELKLQSAVALAKMGCDSCIPPLVDLIFSSDYEKSDKVKKMLKNVDVRFYKNFDKIVKHLVAEKVEKLVPCNENISLNDMDNKNLLTLRWLYCLAEEYDEVESINNILKS
ncbi:MAG: HEAT repeat domain-containing protein [Candidatus Peregrinibacteria bacterium]